MKKFLIFTIATMLVIVLVIPSSAASNYSVFGDSPRLSYSSDAEQRTYPVPQSDYSSNVMAFSLLLDNGNLPSVGTTASIRVYFDALYLPTNSEGKPRLYLQANTDDFPSTNNITDDVFSVAFYGLSGRVYTSPLYYMPSQGQFRLINTPTSGTTVLNEAISGISIELNETDMLRYWDYIPFSSFVWSFLGSVSLVLDVFDSNAQSYNNGYSVGYYDGSADGYTRGEQDGYNKGLAVGESSISPISVLVGGITSIMSMPLVAGLSFSTLLLVCVGILGIKFLMRIAKGE